MRQCRHPNIINYISHHWTSNELWVGTMMGVFFSQGLGGGKMLDRQIKADSHGSRRKFFFQGFFSLTDVHDRL
jgi:hypothetical protein